jgi:hypothetical protein
MNYNRVSDNLNAIQTNNGATIATKDTGGDPSTFGVTLVAATTYVFPFGADRAPVPSLAQLVSTQLRWDNAIAFTATIEECNFPALWPSDQANGVVDVADHNTTVGNWIQIKPPTAYVEVAGGGSYTVATGVIAVAAGQAGGCTINLSAWGGRRGRIKIVVGATGGLVRCALNGKAAA